MVGVVFKKYPKWFENVEAETKEEALKWLRKAATAYSMLQDELWLREGFTDKPCVLETYPGLITAVTLKDFGKLKVLVAGTTEAEVAGVGYIPLSRVIPVKPGCLIECEGNTPWVLHLLMYIQRGRAVSEFISTISEKR